jgi:hypothetical protein
MDWMIGLIKNHRTCHHESVLDYLSLRILDRIDLSEITFILACHIVEFLRTVRILSDKVSENPHGHVGEVVTFDKLF